ncbi:mycofactocin biosynthesis peptidyl-dipeptidase MftE [Dietzia alimentaria]|uniref:mycofactocin biosynthesis peptidyl-dipeptidase MftE n=1 Tax=Dietzia alimentaria TaxID=665550 RepID=UPI00029B08AB|nr:mycofactocin biosynthesis peptidyl-dipeptidase MftE [Dietzia alimentaria]
MTDVAGATGGYVLAVLPLGSTEQHGPHLPFETDTLLATAAAGVVADVPMGPDHVRVLPALAYGASGEHQSFAGTVSMGTDALAETILELGRSITTWAGRLVVINGHGGNVEALRRAVSRLRYEGRDCAWLSCRTAEFSTDTHAGHAETSLMLHLYPELVRPDLARAGCTEPLVEILPAMREGGVAAVSATGVLGDPTTATEADGTRLWEALAADVRDRVGRWNPGGTDGMLA